MVGFRLRCLAAGVGVVAGCAPDNSPTHRLVRDSAGVEIVLSSAPDRMLDWAFTEVRILGGTDAGPEAFFRVNRGTVSTNELGRIFVWDGSSHRVHAFDSIGTHLWSTGGNGGGPGEILGGNSVAADRMGGVAVFDWKKAALVRFDSVGAVLPELPLADMPIRAWEPHVAFAGGGVAVWKQEEFVGQERRQVVLRFLTNQDTVTLVTASPTVSRTAAFSGCPMRITLPALNSTRINWHTAGDLIAVNVVPEYAIEVFAESRKMRSVRRDVKPPIMTEAEALAAYQRRGMLGALAGACRPSAAEMLEHIGFEPRTQLVRGIALGPSGELWVARLDRSRGDSMVVDVFDSAGEYIGTLPSGSPIPLGVLPGDRIVGAHRDTLDVERLVIWQVTRQN